MALAAYAPPMFPPPAQALVPPHFALSMADMLDSLESLRQQAGHPFGRFVRDHREGIAATVQSAVENMVISVCNYIHNLCPVDNLCMAGGLFLNCVLNHKIVRETGYKNIYIVPACGDDGQSIGAAFFAYEQMTERKPVPAPISPYQGPVYTQCDVVSAIEAARLGHRAKTLSDSQLIEAIVRRLSAGETIALFRGRSEMGPRALGHRSILASPQNAIMHDHVNRYVKHRENFRPLAPMVRWEDQFSIFNLAVPSPHMLLTATVRPEWQGKIPAVTHVDGSARIQAVRHEDEPFLHRLLTVMGDVTGVPVVLNTSFNGRGEPIVESPADAIATFLRSNIDAIVVENMLIDRN